MNVYLVIVVLALVGRWSVDLLADWLNLRHVRETLPVEFEGLYDAERYRRSQQYLREKTRLSMVEDSAVTAFTLALILGGGFNVLDRVARACASSAVPTGLVFLGLVGVVFGLLGLPFSAYRTFVVEERYGFNRTTWRTFFLDLLKTLLLAVLLGGPVAALILWLFGTLGRGAWILCWGAVTAFQLMITFLAPYVIMPLFNRFAPLAEGAARSAIEDYARAAGFRMKGVFTMDGSRRSSKANAFFTGFGGSRRIVLFDTLVADYAPNELVAIVAHELGHYRLKHVPQALLRAVATTGLTFGLLSLFLGNAALFAAFRMDALSVHASLVFFGFLYAPLGMLIAMAEGALSRRHERAADAFAVRTSGAGEALISGLKKLHSDSLSDLTPHPLKVFLSYSHPPILERIRQVRSQYATLKSANSPVAVE